MLRLKLAFVGNMNNMPLTYARVIRNLGHEIHFYVDAPPREKLHRPECRYKEYARYPEWMFDVHPPLPLVSYVFAQVFFSQLITRLNSQDYDGIVLDGLALSLGSHLAAPKFALLAGSDLDILCDPKSLNGRDFVRSSGVIKGLARLALHRLLLPRQRAGVRECGGFSYFPEGINPRGEELLDDIYQGQSPYRLQIRGTDVEQLGYVPPSERSGDAAIVFLGVRHLWREPLPAGFSSQENKRNDVAIRGIAEYLSQSQHRPRFVSVEKGPDVPASKALASELGIGEHLEWVAEMTQAEIFEWYRGSDIVIEQLGDHLPGAVAWDSMVTGRPVIANGRPELFQRAIPEPSPLCQASAPSEVAEWLHRLVSSPGTRREIGLASHRYVKEHLDMKDTAAALIAFFQRIKSDEC